MLGYRAAAAADQRIVMQTDEIAEARWFTRQELLAEIKTGELSLPPQSSIARRIIESWYGPELPSGTVPFR
jgi:NAD+ diphosphatase